MNKQTKLIVTGAAIIGGGVLLYYLLKPKKKTRFEEITGTDLNIKEELANKLKNIAANKQSNVLTTTDYSNTLSTTRTSAF